MRITCRTAGVYGSCQASNPDLLLTSFAAL